MHILWQTMQSCEVMFSRNPRIPERHGIVVVFFFSGTLFHQNIIQNPKKGTAILASQGLQAQLQREAGVAGEDGHSQPLPTLGYSIPIYMSLSNWLLQQASINIKETPADAHLF